MFVIKRVYCRIFQQCFHMALPFLPYRNPRLKRRIEDIPVILGLEGVSRPLIITDANLSAMGLADSLRDLLEQADIEYAYFDGAFPNPTVSLAYEAHGFYVDNGCDCLIAFGGGSPMDLAKACGIIEARPDKPLQEMDGILKVRKKLPLMIAIPTTAGTGSETTLAAVIVDSGTGHKFTINDFPLIPKYAVLDHRMIHTVPRDIAAATGIDALTHAVEAYIGRSTTRYTRMAAEKAVHLIFENLDAAVAHTDTDSESAMLVAAHYAGRAFTRSYVGYIHALSHALSGAYGLPHGWTNAVLLPIVLRRYGRVIDKKLARLAVCAGLDCAGKAGSAGSTMEHIGRRRGFAGWESGPGNDERSDAGCRSGGRTDGEPGAESRRRPGYSGLADTGRGSAGTVTADGDKTPDSKGRCRDVHILAERFICAIEAMNRRYGIPDKIPGIREEDIGRLAAYAEAEANPLYPVPVLWGKRELEDVYRSVMEQD